MRKLKYRFAPMQQKELAGWKSQLLGKEGIWLNYFGCRRERNPGRWHKNLLEYQGEITTNLSCCQAEKRHICRYTLSVGIFVFSGGLRIFLSHHGEATCRTLSRGGCTKVLGQRRFHAYYRSRHFHNRARIQFQQPHIGHSLRWDLMSAVFPEWGCRIGIIRTPPV